MSEANLPPGKSRLDTCIFPGSICDDVFLVENTDFAAKESIDFITPIEQLRFSVDVRGTFRLRNGGDDATISQVVSRVAPIYDERYGLRIISMQRIYDIYATNVIREVVRAELSKYSIADSLKNREAIGNNLFVAVAKALEKTPIEVIQFGLAKADPPQTVIEANELRASREIEIERAKAERDIAVAQAEGKRLVALKQQEIDLINAETQVLTQKKLADGYSVAWAMTKYLEFLQTAASNPSTVYLPMASLEQLPAQLAMWNDAMERGRAASPPKP